MLTIACFVVHSDYFIIKLMFERSLCAETTIYITAVCNRSSTIFFYGISHVSIGETK